MNTVKEPKAKAKDLEVKKSLFSGSAHKGRGPLKLGIKKIGGAENDEKTIGVVEKDVKRYLFANNPYEESKD
jgi:hypothetical protein